MNRQYNYLGELGNVIFDNAHIPKKVNDKSTVQDNGIVVGFVGRCPNCNEIIDDISTVCDCGQKLNWEDSE